MRLYTLLFLLLAMLPQAACQQDVLIPKWETHVDRGVESITALDLDIDNEYYYLVTSIDQNNAYLFVYNNNGEETDTLKIPKPLDAQYTTGREKINMVKTTDIDEDGEIDMFSATQIKGGSVNTHFLYRIEHEREPGLDRKYARMQWFDDRVGYVNNIQFYRVNKTDYIFISSMDMRIQIFTKDGIQHKRHEVNTSAWDVAPLYPDRPVDDYMAGLSRMMCRIELGKMTWCIPTETRFRGVEATDLENDGLIDVIGSAEDEVIRSDIQGNISWRKEINDIVGLEIIDLKLAGVKNILVAQGHELIGINPEGNISWRYDVGETINTFIPVYRNNGEDVDVAIGTRDRLLVMTVNQYFAILNAGEDLMAKSRQYLQDKKFVEALNASQRSGKLFEKIKNVEKLNEVGNLISASLDNIQGIQLYESARENCERKQYGKCIQEGEQAHTIFLKHGQQELADQVNVVVDRAEQIVEGEMLYEIASKQFIDGNYTIAHTYAKKAKNLFEKIGDEFGLQKVNALLDLIGTETDIAVDGPQATSTTSSIKTTTTTLKNLSRDWDEDRIKEELIFYGPLAIGLYLILSAFKSRMRGDKPKRENTDAKAEKESEPDKKGEGSERGS